MRNKKDCIAPIKNVHTDLGENLSIIIPCAKCGKDLKFKGNRSLFSVGDITLIERQIDTINKVYPACEIILIVGENGNQIKKRTREKYDNVRYIYNELTESHNVLYSIGLGSYNRLRKNLLFIYGDLLFNKYTIEGITFGSSKLLIDINNTTPNNKPGIVIYDGKIQRLSHGIQPKWGQICYLENKELRLFDVCALKNPNWCGHEGINYIIENGGNFQPFTNIGYHLFEVSTLQDLETIKRMK